ncbi:MAG: oligosaccharide flippase family protein [Candidatus Daviesbacteria bacterium]|nr:oligosaccharide flippase family protein [Candidatus Daviesbacteria bacterium]
MSNDIDSSEHFDATSEITLDLVKKRAIKGVAALTGRTIFTQVVGLIATFLLTLFLTPNQFGVYFIVSAAVNFFNYFADIGLGAAVIQKRETLTRKDLETTFTIQSILVISLVVIIILITPLLKEWQHLDQESVYLLWALAAGLLLSSFKSIPSLLLERELDFNKLVLPQIIEFLLFQVIAVVLAWQGFGVTSYTVAVIVSRIAGLVIIFVVRPWRPGIAFDIDALKGLLRFGLPYQINIFLASIKDDGMTVVLGGILGPANIGLLGWAQKWATAPLRFFMDQVIKVTFPAFSRMQDSKQQLANAVSKSIFFIDVLVFPAVVGLVLLSPILVEIIPKYGKWQPALFALAVISINTLLASWTTPLINALNAIGKIKITFRLMIMWTVLTWIFVPGLAYFYQVNGAAVGYALVGVSSMVAVWVAFRYIRINIWESIGIPFICSVLMGIVLFFGRSILPWSWGTVIILIIAAIFVYAVSLFLLVGSVIMEDIKKILLNSKEKTN